MSISSKFVIYTINILKWLDLNITLLTGKIPIWDSTQHLKSVPIIEGGVPGNKEFWDLFEIEIIKAYKQPFTRNIEDGTFIANHDGEILNSQSEWHQPQIVWTKITIIQGARDRFLGEGVSSTISRPDRTRTKGAAGGITTEEII